VVGQWWRPTFFPRGADVGAPSPPESPPYAYDKAAPVQLQYRDWSCAIVSVHWALSSLGYDVDREALIADMTPAPVSPAVGCLDASGAGLVRYLGQAYDLPARNRRPASWDEVTAVAGQYPCLIGGGGWYHWSAVRDNAPGVLLLANPAPGWRGVYQTLSRGQYESWLGPFALVEVLV
jgi:hypothetical protein